MINRPKGNVLDNMKTMHVDGKQIGGGNLQNNVDVLHQWHRGEAPGPLAVEVSATGGCNHGCLHCGYQQFAAYEEIKSFIDADSYRAFLRDFRELGGVEVFYAGRGDPLLNPNIPDFCRQGHELGLRNTMSTNGVPLGARKMAEMMAFMSWVRFSVNGGDAETYGYIHNCSPKDFEKLERNLSAAADFRDQHNLDVKLIIQFIIYDKNFRSLQGMIDLHRRVGTDSLVIRNVIEKDGSNAMVGDEIRAQLAALEQVDTIDVRWETFNVIDKGPAWSKCHGINFRINLDENGNVYTCTRNNSLNSEIGNVREMSFKDIWNSERKRTLFAEIEPGHYIPMCGRWCDVSKDNVYAEQYVNDHSPVEPAKKAV